MPQIASRLPRPMLFAAVGALNTALDLMVFTVLVGIETAPVAANLVSYSTGIVSSYLLNGTVTFGLTVGTLLDKRRAAAFLGTNLIGLAIGTGVVATLAAPFGALPAKLVSLAATFAWNFAMSRRYAFAT